MPVVASSVRVLASCCLALVVLLAGCASGPAARDGPDAHPPSNLAQVPDAEPRVEPIRKGGPNKPYEVLGRAYTPITVDQPFNERGLASWYGRKFHGRPTANGETYDMYAMTAAHPTLPLPSYVRVRNPANGREVIVRVNDRGPFHAGRIIDLSYIAALKLDLLRGVAPVEIWRLTHDEIRAGHWRPQAEAPVLAQAPPRTEEAAPVEAAARAPAASGAAGFWVQLGAFREREGALGFQQRVAREFEPLAPLLTIFDDAPLFRLQAGPYTGRDEAGRVAQQVRELLQLVPLVVERR